jgi:lysozyme
MPTPYVADMNHDNIIAWPYPRGSEIAGMQALKDAGIVGIIHKARQGVGFADPKFKLRRDNAEHVGLFVGSYDFATGDDVVTNVDSYLSYVGVDDALSYWLDFEDNKHSEMSLEQALEFLDRVSQKIGRACGLYTGNRFKDTAVAWSPDKLQQFGKYPLWLAEYGSQPRLVDANHRPLPWKEAFLWQYTGDGVGPQPHRVNGVENGADLSTCNGTADQLRALWNLATPK